MAIPRNLIPQLEEKVSPRVQRAFLQAIADLKAEVSASGLVALIETVGSVPFDLTTISSGARLGSLQVVFVDARTIVESVNRTSQLLPASPEILASLAAGGGPNAGPARQMIQRQATLREFIAEGRLVSLPEIGVDFSRNIQFTNGRNRFLTAFYNGAQEIPVAVTARDARILKSRGWVTREPAVSQFNRNLLAALAEGDVDAAVRAIPLRADRLAALDQEVRAAYRLAGNETAAGIPARRSGGPTGPILRANFDVTNPRAERWLAESSSSLVREINDGQRFMLRELISAGVERGDNPRRIALDLVGRIDPITGRRSGGMIGLTQKQSRYVINYRNELSSGNPALMRRSLERGLRDRRFDRAVLAAAKNEEPLPPNIVSRLSQQYQDRLLRFRGEKIARHESLSALNQAHQEALRQAVEQGAVRAEQIKRFWRTAGDDRVRDDHVATEDLNRQGVGLNEPFDTPLGPIDHPPLEIECRCFVETQIDFLAGLSRG